MKFSNTRNGTPDRSGRGDETVRVGERGGHRFLQRNRLAGGECGQRGRRVQVVRQQNLHQVDRLQRQELVVVGRDQRAGHPPRAPAPGGELRFAVTQRDDPGVRVAPVFDGMQVGNATGADKSHADSVHGSDLHLSSVP